MRTITRTLVAGLLAAVAAGVTALPTQATPSTGSPSEQRKVLATARAATARFHDVDAAVAAGYAPLGECTESPEGAMGVHYLNPALVHPGIVDPAHPQMLTYGPSPSGKLELWSVEYFEPEVGQPTPKLGSQPFDGPMPGHDPGMPTHYDLHVWVGKHNPAGMYAPFNPAVHC